MQSLALIPCQVQLLDASSGESNFWMDLDYNLAKCNFQMQALAARYKISNADSGFIRCNDESAKPMIELRFNLD